MQCNSRIMKTILVVLLGIVLTWPSFAYAAPKKGLLIYDTIYGSTIEVAYWIKALIGAENKLDVKRLSQFLTVEPYDYVIIGPTPFQKWRPPHDGIYHTPRM